MHCSQQKGQLRPCAKHPVKFLYKYKLITATEKILDLNNSNVTKWGRQKRNLNVIWRLTVQNLIVTRQSVRQQRVQTLMKTLFLHIYTQTHTHCFSGSVQTETSSLLTHKLPLSVCLSSCCLTLMTMSSELFEGSVLSSGVMTLQIHRFD